MSMPPKASTASPTARSTSASSRTSPTTAMALPPASSISAAAVWTVPSSFGWGLSVFASRQTFAPSRAARSAIASPMPRLPPDMTIVRPFSVLSLAAIARILSTFAPSRGAVEPAATIGHDVRHGDRSSRPRLCGHGRSPGHRAGDRPAAGLARRQGRDGRPRREGGRRPGDAARGARDRRAGRRQGARLDRRLLRVRRDGARPAGGRRQQRWGDADRTVPGRVRRDRADDLRRERPRRDRRDEGRAAPDAPARRGEDRQPRLVRRAARRPRPGDLRGEQGGGDRRHRGRGLGVRGLGRHGRRGAPVIHRHRADRGDRDAEDGEGDHRRPRSPRRLSPRSGTGPCTATYRGASARPAR